MLTKKQLIREIEHAFQGVQLEDGLSLKQTKVVDNYGRGCSNEEFVALPQTEITDNWRSLPPEVLDEADALAHLDQKGFRYYIPALMLRLLDNYDPTSMMTIGTLSMLYPKTESKKNLYTLLSPDQKKAVSHFLDALPSLVRLDYEDKKIVPRSLRNYWSQFLE